MTVETYQTEDWEVNPIGTAKRLKRLEDALQIVAGRYLNGCESFRPPSNCLTAGRTIDAKYGADQWCDGCVAREALNEA